MSAQANEIKKLKWAGKATFTHHGSEMRSGLCSLETGYLAFEINGVEYKWFNEIKGEKMFPKYGEYDIAATVTSIRTLQRVKLI